MSVDSDQPVGRPPAPVASGEAIQRDTSGERPSMWHIPLPRIVVLVLTLIAILAPLALYQSGMTGYTMSWDDFPMISDAMNWDRTQQSLWQPFHNHLFPLYRLLTWVLVSSAGRLSVVPSYLMFGWMIGLVVSLLMLHEFVSRETGSSVHGMVAVLLSGMTTSFYMEAGLYPTVQIFWAVSFSLMVLLFLQSMRDGFRWWPLVGAALLALLAPAWRTEGLLAGPVGSLYALVSSVRGAGPRQRAWMAGGPLLGMCLFVGLALFLCGSELLHSPGTVQGSSLVGSDPLRGAYLTARMGTEHLVLWNFGLRIELESEQFVVLFGLLTAFVASWLRRAKFRAMAITGLSVMVLNYMLVYTIRGNLGLEGVRMSPWYLIFPQFGWATFLCAGLDPQRQRCGRIVTPVAVARLVILAMALFLLHRPLAIKLHDPALYKRQQADLRRLEMIEQLSHQWGVDGTTLARAIGPIAVSGSGGFDGLRLINPPLAARQWDLDEVRRLFLSVNRKGCDHARWPD